MAIAYSVYHFGYCLRQAEVYRYGSREHCQYCYPYKSHHAVATVSVSGVSLTNVRLACCHAIASKPLILAPCESVTNGAAVAAIGMVTFFDKGCILVHPQPPPSGV